MTRSVPRSTCPGEKASKTPVPTSARARASSPVKATTVAGRGAVGVGDAIRIERRYVVDGALTSVEDSGRFRGVELVGTSEHIVLEQGRRRTVRMIPLHSVSEITLEKKAKPSDARAVGDAFDPSVA